jgi:DNA modification methylase
VILVLVSQESPPLVIAHQSPHVTIYRADAAAVIDVLPKNSIDLLVTDPPYGANFQSNRRSKRFERLAGDDGTLDVPGLLGAAMDLLRSGRHVYVFGYAPEQLAAPLKLSATTEVIWDKQMLGMGDLSIPWATSHERITFGVYRPSKSQHAAGDGRLAARLRTQSILRVPRKNATGVKRHPTEKPVLLMRQLIESSTVVGDTIFDPFIGCGSSLVAAVLAGRRAIGVEIDKDYCDIAVARVKWAEALANEMADC